MMLSEPHDGHKRPSGFMDRIKSEGSCGIGVVAGLTSSFDSSISINRENAIRRIKLKIRANGMESHIDKSVNSINRIDTIIDKIVTKMKRGRLNELMANIAPIMS